MTKLISHRGNIRGPEIENENNPIFIDKAIKLGYDVEVDVRLKNNIFFLGHDESIYEINHQWIISRKKHIWFHCKDLESYYKLHNLDEEIIKFCHVNDPYVIISNGLVWVHDLTLNLNNLCVIPVIDNKNFKKDILKIVHAICTDYPEHFKNILVDK